MKAEVYYIELTEPQRAKLNAEGWQGELGGAYLRAKDGLVDHRNRSLFKLAARGDFDDSEQTWRALQNLDASWSDQPHIDCLTEFPRSMDVGDVIVWSDGRAERCASLGFEPIEFEPDAA